MERGDKDLSKAVENRIVDMTFNGLQFNVGVKETIGNLEALKKSLDMSEAAKNFNEIDTAADKVSFDAIAESLDYISKRLSFVDNLFDQFFANIIARAADAGKRMISSLSIDQISAGWDKYGQKVASVQTIMNATGKDIDAVNGYLEQLMWFSDETSYGFTDMTQALGQMASSGGEVEKLIPLITGVANATAFAGKGAAEFSRIMYNLNQSYAQGYLGLMDWKSIELAGAASKQLKEALIEAAEAQGKINEGSVTMANFSETLKEKWADTEVIEAAFGRFAEASQEAYKMVNSGEVDTASEAYEILASRMDGFAIKAAKSAQEAKTFGEAISATQDAVSSGWMETYELLFGNYEEAKVLWTDLANTLWDVFASGAESRNALIKEWVDLGGKESALRSISQIWEKISKVVGTVKEAFRDIFPPTTALQLFNITVEIEKFAQRLDISGEKLEKIKTIARGVFSTISIGIKLIKAIGDGLIFAAGKLKPFLSAVIDLAVAFSVYIRNIDEALEHHSLFEVALNTLSDLFNTTKDKIIGTIENIKEAITGFVEMVKTKLHFKSRDEPTGLEKLISKLKEQFNWLKDFRTSIPKIFESVQSYFQIALEKFKKIMNNTIDHFTLNSIANLVGTVFGTGVMAAIFGFVRNLNKVPTQIQGVVGKADKVLEQFQKVFDQFASKIHGVLDQIIGILDGVRKSLVVWQQSIQAKTLFTIAKAIAILAASLVVLSFVPAERLGVALVAMTVTFIELIAALEHFVKSVSKFDFRGIQRLSIVMISFAKSMVILSIAILLLSSLDWDELVRGLVGVGVAMLELVGFLKLLSMISGKIPKVASQLVTLGIALNIFAVAVRSLGKLNGDQLVNGLVGVGVVLAEIAGFMAAIGAVKTKSFKPASIVILAGALMLMSKAVNAFGTLDPEALGRGLIALGGVLLGIGGFMALVGSAKHVLSTSVAMVVFGEALKIMGDAIAALSLLSWEGIGKGLAALGGSLLVIAAGVRLLPKGLLMKALDILGIVEAIRMLTKPIITLSGLSWNEIARGLTAMAGGLLVIAGAIRLMPNAIKMGEADFGLAGFAIALTIFASAFNKLKSGSWEEMGLALVSLAGSLAITAGAMALMRNGIPGAAAMLIMSAALAVFTPAIIALANTPWQGLVAALLALAGIFAVIGVAATLLTPVIIPIIGLAGAITLLGVACAGIGAGILAFSTGLAALAAIGTAGALSLGNTIRMLADMIPYIITKVAEGLVAFLSTIKENSTEIGNATAALILAIADAIKKNTVAIMAATGELILGFLTTIAAYLPQIVETGMLIIETLLSGIASHIGNIALTVGDIIIAFINAVALNLPEIILSAVNLMYNFILGLSAAVQMYTPLIVEEVIKLGGYLIEGLIEGIGNAMGKLGEKILEVGSNMIGWLKDKLGIHSPSTEFANIGGYSIDGLIEGLGSKDAQLSNTMGDIGATLLDSLKTSTSGIPQIGQDSMDELDDSFATGFNDANDQAFSGMSNVLGTMGGFTSQFGDQGTLDIQALIGGMKSQEYDLNSTSSSLTLGSLNEIASYKPKFSETGRQLIAALAGGMKDNKANVVDAAHAIALAAYQKLDEFYEEFYEVGETIVWGFIRGMRSQIQAAARAAAEIAMEAYEAAMDAVDAHSPSRKFFKLGQWVDEGFANGISAYGYYVSDATRAMSDDTINSFSSTVRGIAATLMDEFDETPTIRPVVDLSNVEAASREVDTLLSKGTRLNLTEPINMVGKVAASVEPRHAETIQNGSEDSQPVTQNFTFNQNNYSPKTLSRLDIYRQTQNQFRQFREKVTNP